MNRKRTSSFHLKELTKSPTNYNGLFAAINASGKKARKFKSAFNSTGKRLFSEIKPRRLDFSNTEATTLLKNDDFKKLLKFGPKDLFKPKASTKRVKNISLMETEGKNKTPVKPKFGKGMLNFQIAPQKLGQLLRNSPQTLKKQPQTSIENHENAKTKSGKKQRKNSNHHLDKRSNSFSTSVIMPSQSGVMALEKAKRKHNKKNLVIHKYMMRNQSFFKDKYKNTSTLQDLSGQFLGLERSNSDVIMNYDANKSFNKKYENGYQGENKYLNAGGQKFKAP